MLEKAGITGIATMGLGVCFFGFGRARWAIPGTATTIPLEFLTLGLGVANSFVADGLHQFINKAVPLGKKTSDRVSVVSNAVISGITFFGLLHLGGAQVPYDFTPMRAFITGSVGELAGSAGYEYLLNNMYI